MFAFAAPRLRRRIGLTPMIEVVFLLLVFFILAARFGIDGALPLATHGGQAEYQGPPRLVAFSDDGLRLNGVPVAPDALPDALAALMQTPDDPVILRPDGDAGLQALATLADRLRAAGITRLVLVEGAP